MRPVLIESEPGLSIPSRGLAFSARPAKFLPDRMAGDERKARHALANCGSAS
jgi:hypothetical protein